MTSSGKRLTEAQKANRRELVRRLAARFPRRMKWVAHLAGVGLWLAYKIRNGER